MSGISSDHHVLLSSVAYNRYMLITNEQFGILIFGQSADRTNVIAEIFADFCVNGTSTIKYYQIPSFLGIKKYKNKDNHILIELGIWGSYNIVSLFDYLTYHIYNEGEIDLSEWSEL